METIKKYYVYGITFYNERNEIICIDYYLNEKERDFDYEQGDSSRVYPNTFPIMDKGMFHFARTGLNKYKKRKTLYLVEEPINHEEAKIQDYKMKEIIENERNIK